MRGLFTTALLVGPTLVSALLEPAEHGDVAGKSPALIAIDIPSVGSPPGETVTFPFQIQVLSSERPCGYGNVTINDQELAQEVPGGDETTSIGSGPVTSRGAIVDATWFFECITVDSQPNSQLLRFLVTAVEGAPVVEGKQPGFTVLFTQTGATQILSVLSVTTDLPAPGTVPSPETLAPINRDDGYTEARVDEELADLDWMISQLEELEHLVEEKRAAIAHYTHKSGGKKEGCDSLRCTVKQFHRKIRCAARKIHSKIHNKIRGGHAKHDEHTEEWRIKPYKKHHRSKKTQPRLSFWSEPHRSLPPHREHREPHDKSHHDEKPHDRPHGPPGHHEPPRPDRPGHRGPSDQEGPPPRPGRGFTQEAGPHGGHRPPPPRPGHFHGHDRSRHGLGFLAVLPFIKFIAIGVILGSLVSAIVRRTCREERHRRHGSSCARRHQAFRRFLARITGRPVDRFSDEKSESQLEDGLSVTLRDEITQFRNVAGVVGDIIAAEGQRSRSMTAHEIENQAGEAGGLPAYNDHDDSELSSIADGFRYTPGSTVYDPMQSRRGSVGDIIGPDVKN